MINENVKPAMTDPLGKCWDQPSLSGIEIDDTHALMSESDFNKLKDYSCSSPSGVYEGKMWKCKWGDNWVLRWWSNIDNSMCECNQRVILIA